MHCLKKPILWTSKFGIYLKLCFFSLFFSIKNFFSAQTLSVLNNPCFLKVNISQRITDFEDTKNKQTKTSRN